MGHHHSGRWLAALGALTMEQRDIRPGMIIPFHGTDPPITFLQRPSLAYDFPLSPNYMAQLVLPRDLTQKEVERLAAFLNTLVIPEPQEAPK